MSLLVGSFEVRGGPNRQHHLTKSVGAVPLVPVLLFFKFILLSIYGALLGLIFMGVSCICVFGAIKLRAVRKVEGLNEKCFLVPSVSTDRDKGKQSLGKLKGREGLPYCKPQASK